jgi:hypothetical protein
MHFAGFVFYGGPDQIMGVTSGLAGLAGVLLLFWNRIVTTFFRILRVFRPSTSVSSDENRGKTLTGTP